MTNQVDPLQFCCLKPAAKPGRKPGNPESPPQPRQVRKVHRATFSQHRNHERPPTPRARQTMHEHNRRAVAVYSIPDASSVDLEPPKLHTASLPPPRLRRAE